MWGTVHPTPVHRRQTGFIPTYVGNRSDAQESARLLSVHPHVCGEQGNTTFRLLVSFGSSPRMWGTGTPVNREHRSSRFIPTYVGNSRQQGRRHQSFPVHPHVCGEQIVKTNTLPTTNGSSPRMWGTDASAIFCQYVCRFIPTYVGNRVSASIIVNNLNGSSPRMWGTGKNGGDLGRTTNGSSPRMWGTALKGTKQRFSDRFIPTYVGNS